MYALRLNFGCYYIVWNKMASKSKKELESTLYCDFI